MIVVFIDACSKELYETVCNNCVDSNCFNVVNFWSIWKNNISLHLIKTNVCGQLEYEIRNQCLQKVNDKWKNARNLSYASINATDGFNVV